MPTLLLLNGPPGIGKSTLAHRWVADRPLSLRLDVDEVRAMLGQWEPHAHSAGLRARALACAMARVHLADGHDVVVPQFLAKVEFAAALEEVARDVRAALREVVLAEGDVDERLATLLATRRATVVQRVAGDVEGTYASLVRAVASG